MNIRRNFVGLILIVIQITLIRAQDTLTKENGIIRDIKARNFDRAWSKIEGLEDDLQGSMNYIIHEVYNHIEGNFDLILQFMDGTRGTLLTRLATYRALNDEIKDQKDYVKTLKLIKSFNKNFDFNSHIDGADELKNQLHNTVTNIIIEKLQESLASNDSATMSTIFENIYVNYRALFKTVFKQALSGVFENINEENLIKYFKTHKYVSQSIYGYSAVFNELKKRNSLNKKSVVDLAFGLRRAMDANHDANLEYDAIYEANALEDDLPKSVKILAFAYCVRIKNLDYPNEYLYAASDGYKADSERRNLFTYKPGVKVNQGTWLIEQNDDVYHIRNEKHNEYMYASYSKANGYWFGRPVYTWVPKGTDNNDLQFNWVFEPIGDDMYIKNAYAHEYLYASSEKLNEARRKVFTRIREQTKHKGSLWTIEYCW